MPNNDFQLWDCPPLHARITRRQCLVNQARARAGAENKAPRGFAEGALPPGRQECLTCPGVRWWANRTGRAPLILRARDVLEDLRRREALRRALGGAENDGPVSPAVRRARTRRARLGAGGVQARP